MYVIHQEIHEYSSLAVAIHELRGTNASFAQAFGAVCAGTAEGVAVTGLHHATLAAHTGAHEVWIESRAAENQRLAQGERKLPAEVVGVHP